MLDFCIADDSAAMCVPPAPTREFVRAKLLAGKFRTNLTVCKLECDDGREPIARHLVDEYCIGEEVVDGKENRVSARSHSEHFGLSNE